MPSSRLTHSSRGDKLAIEDQGPRSPLLPSAPLSTSPLFHNTLTSLCLSHFSLLCSHSLLFLSFSPNWPSCPSAPHRSPSCLTSPNEEPNNNTGHRSRERTGCVHNRPVAPTKTIIPFSFPALLHCCQDWK